MLQVAGNNSWFAETCNRCPAGRQQYAGGLCDGDHSSGIRFWTWLWSRFLRVTSQASARCCRQLANSVMPVRVSWLCLLELCVHQPSLLAYILNFVSSYSTVLLSFLCFFCVGLASSLFPLGPSTKLSIQFSCPPYVPHVLPISAVGGERWTKITEYSATCTILYIRVSDLWSSV